MNYKINQSMLDTSFRVPACIVDDHIKLANADQLKVLLWILRNNPENPDISAMCRYLRMSEADAADYLLYWVLTGVLKTDDTEPAQSTAVPESAPSEPAPVSVPVTVVSEPVTRSKPTGAEISARTEESPEIRALFNEAQQKLGKTIGYEGQATLLMLHDYDGLPVEVIYMLLDYCVSVGKTHNSYLAATGRDWGEKEIDTIEKAAEKIQHLRSADKVWVEFSSLAGIKTPKPTTSQARYLNRWNLEMGFSAEMIYLAYEEMADHTQKVSFAYMDKILENWHKKGIKTPEDVERDKSDTSAAKRQSTPAPSGYAQSKKPSYNIDSFNAGSVSGELHYERKKK